jgi:RHS repeat-associated protein
VDQLLADEQLLPSTSGGGAGGEGYNLSQPGNIVWTLGDNENTIRDLATYDPTANGNAGETTIVNHRVFSAYGQLLSQTNPSTLSPATVDCLFAYTGEALDTATSLQNNDNRWYNAITGRWLSQDPSGLGPDTNPYRYCGNGPTIATDPFGTTSAVIIQEAFQPQSGWDRFWGNPPISTGHGVAGLWETGSGQNTLLANIGTAQIQPSIGVGPTVYGDITLYPEYGGGTLTRQEARAAGILSKIPANARGAGESKADYIKRLIAAARKCPNPRITKVYSQPTHGEAWTPPVNPFGVAVVTYSRTVYTLVNGKIVSETPQSQNVTGVTNGNIVSFSPPPGWGGETDSEVETNPHGPEPEPVQPR